MKFIKSSLNLIMLCAFASMIFLSGPVAIALCVGAIALAATLPSTAMSQHSYRSDISPDISQIQKYLGKVKPQLIRKFFNDLAVANDITVQPNVKNKLLLPKLIINGKPRPYTGNHMPNAGDIGYGDRELIVDQFQRDFSIDPRKYRNTYLAEFRPSGEGANANTIPFAQYTLETAILQNSSILNDQVVWNGLGKAAFAPFNAGTVYASGDKIVFAGTDGEPHYYIANAATTAGQSPTTHPAKWDNKDELAITEGLGTKLKAGRTGGSILAASTGVITNTDGYKQAVMVYRKLSEALRNQAKEICLFASNDTIDKISDSFTDIQKFTNADKTVVYLPGTDGKCKLVRASWMAGSGTLVAAPKSNLYMGTDLLSDFNEISTIPHVYKLDMGLAGLIGFQYADADAVVLNDQN